MKKSLAKAFLLLASFLVLFSGAPRAAGQSTASVRPRIYTLLNNVLLAPKQNLTTNANSAFPSITNQVAAWTNTLTPPVGTHPIGLQVQINTTNNLAGASNLVVTVYPAYDLSIGTSGIGQGMGTNFATNCPLLTWTISYTTNLFATTNIAPLTWEPATSFAVTVNNQCNSNTTVTVTASQAP
jgi:hypothetical protein